MWPQILNVDVMSWMLFKVYGMFQIVCRNYSTMKHKYIIKSEFL